IMREALINKNNGSANRDTLSALNKRVSIFLIYSQMNRVAVAIKINRRRLTGEAPAEASISLGVSKYISGVASNLTPHALRSSRSITHNRLTIIATLTVYHLIIVRIYLSVKTVDTLTSKTGIAERKA